MPHVSRLNDEDHVLGDVCGMVSDALDVSRYEYEVDTGLDRPWIAEHVREQFSKDVILERAHPIVLGQHGLSEAHVSRDERIQRLAEHLEREVTHLGQIDQGLDRRMEEVSLRRFANIDGEISHA